MSTIFSGLSLMSGLSLATSAVSGIGQVIAGRAEKKVYEENAKVALQKAAYEEEKSRKRTKYLLGTQRTLYAKAGVDISSGSPLAFGIYTASEGEKEALMERWGGEVEAKKQERYGRAAMQKGITGGISTFLTGAERAYKRV